MFIQPYNMPYKFYLDYILEEKKTMRNCTDVFK